MRCLISVTTLKVLNLAESLAFLAGESTSDDEDPYLTDSQILIKIHNIIKDAGEAGSVTASPSVFAWAVLSHRMFSSYQIRLEKRDSKQHQRSLNNFEQNLDLESQPRLARRNSDASMVSMEAVPYDQFLNDSGLAHEFREIERIATSVIGRGEVFQLISEMASGLGVSPASMFPATLGSRMRLVLMGFVCCTHPFVQYQAEPVAALLSSLSGGRQYWDLTRPDHFDVETDILAQALGDSAFLQQYFYQSLNRYPLEFLPFIEFCRALSGCLTLADESDESGLVLELLLKTRKLTFILPDDFQGYELAMEEDEENSNAFRLTRGLNLFTETTSTWSRGSGGSYPFKIPANTFGRFVTDSGRIVQMEYEHSSLSLIGKRLEVSLHSRHYETVLGSLEMKEISAAISLIATLLQTETLKASKKKTKKPWEAGTNLLEDLSAGLSRNRDIISIVCDILDHHMEEELSDAESAAMSVLTACVQFMHAILTIAPGRLWSYMIRCALLNTEAKAGRLSTITANTDIILERFNFLVSSTQLMLDMIESAMKSSVQRKAPSQLKGRVENLWVGTSDKLLARVCFTIAQTVVDMFENSSTWRFATEAHRNILMQRVIPTLNKILSYAFALGDSKLPGPLTACLEPAAIHIVDSFLLAPAGSLRFQPFLMTLLSSHQLPESTLYPWRLEAFSYSLVHSLEFAATLVRVARQLEKPQTVIEGQLLMSATLLARVCAVNCDFRRHSLALFEALVLSAASHTVEPPSLLGYLSAPVSKSFLGLLSTLDRPFNQTEEVNRVWRFFSSILRNRQQWMANCLLTGKMPSESARRNRDMDRPKEEKETKSEKAHPPSVLSMAVSRASRINEIPATESLAILDFLTSALNYYPWTTFTIQKEGQLIDSLRRYMHFLPGSNTTARTNTMQATHHARIAAYLAEVFAMLIYHLRQIGDADELAEHVMQDLDYFLREGVAVGGYNASLHSNFGKNFERQFAGCRLEWFKRTLLEPGELGIEFYYSLGYADDMLRFDPGWVGSRNNGFRSEMERANSNLSLVDAQVALYHAWEFLLLELTNCDRMDKRLLTNMLQVANQCLEANKHAHGPERFFQRLSQSRASLCLLLTRRLVEKSPKFADVTSLLRSLWSSISSIPTPFTSGDAEYYRTLLKILFVALRAYSRFEDEAMSDLRGALVEQAILNIIDKVVAQNFRTLVTLIHEPEVTTNPSDLALLTAILQSCLRMPGMEESQTQILNILANHDVLRVAIALFSWSDKLAVPYTNGKATNANGNGGTENGPIAESDPIYGELSLLFLRELSMLPQIAEAIAAEGVLSQVASASITSYIRRPNVGPLADTVAAQRCYSIWAKGILPILVSVLKAVGATIAPEVTLVLNQFSNLLEQSVQRIEPPGKTRMSAHGGGGGGGGGKGTGTGYVTLLALSEVHSLALLERMISEMKRSQPGVPMPELAWDKQAAEENVELWMGTGRKILRGRIIALGAREAEWRSMRPSGATEKGGDVLLKDEGFETRLEQLVMMALGEARMIMGGNDKECDEEGKGGKG